ncbi:unnamed protein product [Symbiodinium sp. CCMP2592]|nr:unnamed protein product [Symbiodinium sp. CCMP2592]
MASKSGPETCRTCHRSFKTTLNPCVADPQPENLLKRRAAGAAQCKPCFNFMMYEDPYRNMSTEERYQHCDNEENHKEYMGRLNPWEESRRRGGRRARGAGSSTAEAVNESSLETRQVMGYLWPVSLLKAHQKPVPKKLQSIPHMGKQVKGAILHEFVVGAIEVATQSAKKARITTVVADADELDRDDSSSAFASMQRSVAISSAASSIEGHDMQLKIKAKGSTDSDDEMAAILWGDSSIGGAKAAKDSDSDEDKPKNAKNKRNRTRGRDSLPNTSGGNIGGPSDLSNPAGTPSSSSLTATPSTLGGFGNPGTGNTSLSSLGSLLTLPRASKKRGNEVRELERSEQICLQAEHFKAALQDPNTKLELNKVVKLKERIQQRLTDEFTTMYMDAVRTLGPECRAAKVWDNLKDSFRLVELACDFIEALADQEATPDTLSSRARSLEEQASVKLPRSITSAICRRSAEELMQAGSYDKVIAFLDPTAQEKFPNGIAAVMPAEDPSNPSAPVSVPDDVRDFQVTCLVACLTQLFMTPVPPVTKDGTEDQKLGPKREEVLNGTIGKLNDFFKVWQSSSLCSQLTEAKNSIVDEMAKLFSLVTAAVNTTPVFKEAAACEQLEATRTGLLKVKTGVFYAAIAMSPIGSEICARVSQGVQQHRADVLLSMELESALEIAQSLKALNPESLLKTKDGEVEVVVPQQHKIVDMVSKLACFKEKASKDLQDRSVEPLTVIESKITALSSSLEVLISQRYTSKFSDSMTPLMAAMTKGALGEDSHKLYEMITCMVAYLPLGKIPLCKLLGKASGEAFERRLAVVAAFMCLLKDGFALIVKMLTKDFNEDLLSQPAVTEFYTKLQDKEARDLLANTAPFLETSFQQMLDAMQACLTSWLGQVGSTFVKFLNKLSEPDMTVEAVRITLREDVLGAFDVKAVNADEAELDWFFAFNTYIKHMGTRRVLLPGEGGESKHVHAAYICVAGALLRIAKYVMVILSHEKVCQDDKVLLFREMLHASVSAPKGSSPEWETKMSRLIGCQVVFEKLAQVTGRFDEMFDQACSITGDMDSVTAFYKAMQTVTAAAASEFIAAVGADFASMQGAVLTLYQDLTAKNDLDTIFKSDVLDKQSMLALCTDPNMQGIVLSCAKAERFLPEVASILSRMKNLKVPQWMSESTATLISALQDDVQKFHAMDGSVDKDKQTTKISMATARYVNGSMTLGQALSRDLLPGETRIGLVGRCQNILAKKGIAVEPMLLKKVSAMKGGGK